MIIGNLLKHPKNLRKINLLIDIEDNSDRKLIFYCDGGFSRSKFPLSPAYGSFIHVEQIILRGHTKPSNKWSEQKFINHPVEISTTQMSEVATLRWLLGIIKNDFSNEKEIIIRMDSRFTINAVQGNYKLKVKRIIPIVKETSQLLKSCKTKINFEWISGNVMKTILGH